MAAPDHPASGWESVQIGPTWTSKRALENILTRFAHLESHADQVRTALTEVLTRLDGAPPPHSKRRDPLPESAALLAKLDCAADDVFVVLTDALALLAKLQEIA